MTHYQLVAANKRRSAVIMVGFVLFIVTAVYVMSQGLGYGLSMVGFALVVSGLISLSAYWWSDKMILGISKAKPANRQQYFDFFTTTENLCLGQRLPMPKLYVINDSAMNAFATGRDPEHAVVVATTGLLERLNRSEIEAVVGHELSHVKNYDIRLMSIVAILVGLISLIADWFLRSAAWGRGRNDDRQSNQLQMIFFIVGILLALLSPLIAQLIKLAISRRREFLADAGSVAMTKNPQGMIAALEKISTDREPLEVANKATAHLYISDPLKNRHDQIGWFAKLFQTHPSVTERIQTLQQISV